MFYRIAIKTMNGTIEFLLDNKPVTVNFVEQGISPTITVLKYLRNVSSLKGTKEGCGEGDCGACTVVIAELNDGKLTYRAVNSCLIFLPNLHGKQLITVEHIGSSDNLHPVQKILVEKHASQCGFCTPGIVMSIFALYKSNKKVTKETVEKALSGNLCRCTGYRPIIEAAMEVCNSRQADKFDAITPEVIKHLTRINNQNKKIIISTEKNNYYIPQKLKSLLKIRNNNPSAVLCSGTSDVALTVSKKKEDIPKIIDISFVKKLNYIKDKENYLEIGSGATINAILPYAKKYFKALYDILIVFGANQIRNKATIGGNIANASPVGDTLPVLMAYNSIVLLQSKDEKRRIKLRKFVIGYRNTCLKKNEIIRAVIIPKAIKPHTIFAYKLSKRKELDISTVSIAVNVLIESTKIKKIAIFYGGMAATVKRAALTENFLKGKKWKRDNIESAMKIVEKEFSPISDARAQSKGRRIMAKNLLMKAYIELNSYKVESYKVKS